MRKLNILLLSAVVMSAVSLVSVTIADVTDHWGKIEQSGEILRVPWKTSTVLGLWTTCTSRESGFAREEVYTYRCYPTKEGDYVSAASLEVSQSFVVVTTVFTATAVMTGGLHLLIFPSKTFILLAATVLSILSVISSSVSLATFQNSLQTALTPGWSFYVGAASLGCKVLAAVGYIATAITSCVKPNRVQSELQSNGKPPNENRPAELKT